MLLAVDGSGRVVLMTASSGHMLMVQQTTAGPPLAVNLNGKRLSYVAAAWLVDTRRGQHTTRFTHNAVVCMCRAKAVHAAVNKNPRRNLYCNINH